MEEIFDLREFVLNIFRRFKLIIIFGVIFGLLGGIYGFLLADDVEVETYTATSAASVNLVNGAEAPQWSPSNMMTMVDALCSSDFVYANFSDFLIEKGYGSFYEGIDTAPTVLDTKEFAKFHIKGNLLFVDINSTNSDTSLKVSELSIQYLCDTLKGYLNNIEVKPQGTKTTEILKIAGQPKPMKGIKYGVLGFAGGIILSIMYIFFLDIFDLHINKADDLKKYNLPILGIIPKK